METALSHYQQHAKDYVPDIYKAKETELSQQILVDIYRVFEKQLAMYKKDSQEKIQKIFDRLTIKKGMRTSFSSRAYLSTQKGDLPCSPPPAMGG